ELMERVRIEHMPKLRQSTQRTHGRILKILENEIGAMKVAAVTSDDVERLHTKRSKTGPGHANRIIAVLAKAFTLAIKWKMRTDNPCKGVDRNPDKPRERFLTDDELQRLTEVLTSPTPRYPSTANLMLFLLLTGARLGETLKATWGQ